MTLSAAQLRALTAFLKKPGDPFPSQPVGSLTRNEVFNRSGGNFSTLGKTLDALEKKGFVIGRFGAVQYLYYITAAGRAVLEETGPRP